MSSPVLRDGEPRPRGDSPLRPPGLTPAGPAAGSHPVASCVEPRRGRRETLALTGAIAAAVGGTVLARRTAAHVEAGVPPVAVFEGRWGTLAEITAWFGVFAVGAACVRAVPRRSAVPLIAGVAIGLRLAALAPVAPLSDDLYRYAWDGRVQAAGVDPYAHAPVDPALAELRERSPWLWPDAAGCAHLRRGPGCSRLNRDTVPTVYPPVAQLFFFGGHALLTAVPGVGGDGPRDLGYELVGLGVDAAVMALLLLLLARWRRDPRWLVLYAWNPVAVLEAVQNAHVDVLAALFVLLAVGWARRRPALAAAVVGLAALVKVYPAVVLAAVVRRRPLTAALAALAAFGAVVVAGYLPHVAAAGLRVAGYLPAYLRDNGYGSGDGYLLLSPLGLHGTAASATAALVLGAVAWSALRDPDMPADVRARRLLGTVLLLSTPGSAWYGLPLLAVAALGGAWWWLAVPAAAYPAYFAASLSGPGRPLAIGGYAAALILVTGAHCARARHRRSRLHRIARGGSPARGGA